MKRIVQFFLLALFLSFFSLSISAQPFERQILNNDGSPKYIKFNTQFKTTAKNAKSVLKKYVYTNASDDVISIKSEIDKLGEKHEEFQQYFKGIKVEYGVYKVHSKNDVITSINGEYKSINKDLNTKAGINESTALQNALNYVNAEKYMWESQANENWAKEVEPNQTFYPKGELVVVSNTEGNGEMVLAYKFNIYAEKPVSRAFVYVDAQTGAVVHSNQLIHQAIEDGTGETRYSGTRSIKTESFDGTYRLRDYSRGDGIIIYDMNEGTNYDAAVDFTDNDNVWTSAEFDNLEKDNIAIEASWAFGEIYDYWLEVHGRNSYDNNGALMKAYVHYSVDYDNAYWNGSVFTFGDGSDTYFDALAALDVSAHEEGHAVCTHTANLTYLRESGALNEAFSDIWGACLEAYAAPEKMVWVMGEDIERRDGYIGLRILSDPKAAGLPDTYLGEYWVTQGTDNGGVHTNNGPFCYWFYLTSEGGTGVNDNGLAYDIQGITIQKAEQIAYRAESVYMTSGTQYADARNYVILAAEDLYGAGSNEVIQVTNAMAAIGVGDMYSGEVIVDTEAPTAPSNLVASNIAQTSLSLSWTASTDNIAVTAYDVYKDGSLFTTVTSNSANISGLTASTSYTFYVNAKDAAGNISASSNTINATTLDAVVDNEAPSTPLNLLTNTISYNSVGLSWDASTDNIAVVGYDVYVDGIFNSFSSGTSTTISGLTENTSYSFYVVAKDGAGNLSTASNVVNATTLVAPTEVTYCTLSSISNTYEWIDLVDFAGIYNVSSRDEVYNDFTSLVANVTAGNAYPINFSYGYWRGIDVEYWNVWIDFNHDGVFDDLTELVVNGSASSSDIYTETITIPADAFIGETRMRVAMSDDPNYSSCGTFASGEVEDYSVNISNTAISSFTNTQSSGLKLEKEQTQLVSVYPNPSNAYLNISLNNRETIDIKIFNLQGAVIKEFTSSESLKTIDISDLKSGLYHIFISGETTNFSTRFVKQ